MHIEIWIYGYVIENEISHWLKHGSTEEEQLIKWVSRKGVLGLL